MILSDEPSPEDVEFLEDQIDEHNMVRTGRRDFRPLVLFVRGEEGELLAGLYAFTWAGWLEVKFVWVREDLRGRGHGRRLIQAAEAEARARGCRRAWLDSYTFQAPTFYQKLGYEVFGSLQDYPMLAGDVRLEGKMIIFDYIGKGHKHHVQHVVDRDARSIVGQLLGLRVPEQRLFAFWDSSRWVDLHAGDVNHYLREASGMSSSAKEFRTWNATALGASALAGAEAPRSKRAADRAMKSATTMVADYLGNTPAIARRSYVDPRVFNSYRSGWTIHPEVARLGIGLEARPPTTRRPVEVAVLDLIQERWDSQNLRALSAA